MKHPLWRSSSRQGGRATRCVYPSPSWEWGRISGRPDARWIWQQHCREARSGSRCRPQRWILAPSSALAEGPEPDKVYSLRGCFVDDFALDPSGLSVIGRCLENSDPSITLHSRRPGDAFGDGPTATLDRSRVGVVLAALAHLPTDRPPSPARSSVEPRTRGLLEKAREHSRPTPRTIGACRNASAQSRVTALPATLIAQALELAVVH